MRGQSTPMTTSTKTRRETMTSRERLLKALNHEIPDRVPIDLGGNQTGIHKFAYQALLKHLGIRGRARHHGRRAAARPALRGAAGAVPRRHALHCGRRPGRFYRADRAKPPRRAAVARPARRVRRGLVHARRPALLHGHLPSSAGRGHDRRSGRLSLSPRRRSQPLCRACAQRALRLRKETPYAVVSGIAGVVYEICWYMRGLEQLVHRPRDRAGVLRSPAGPDA